MLWKVEAFNWRMMCGSFSTHYLVAANTKEEAEAAVRSISDQLNLTVTAEQLDTSDGPVYLYKED